MGKSKNANKNCVTPSFLIKFGQDLCSWSSNVSAMQVEEQYNQSNANDPLA